MKKIELYLSDEEWAFAQGLFQRLGYSYAVFEVENLSFSFSPHEEEVKAREEAFEAEKAEEEAIQRKESWEKFKTLASEIEWEEHETLENLVKDLEGEVEE